MFSNNRRAAFVVPAALTAFAAVAGCAKTNPVVGTWTGKTPMGGSATLMLAADGTGTVSVPPVMESKPVTWTQGEDKSINLSFTPAAPAGGAATSNTTPGGGMAAMTMPATLGEDNQTLSLKFPMFALTLSKSDAAK